MRSGAKSQTTAQKPLLLGVDVMFQTVLSSGSGKNFTDAAGRKLVAIGNVTHAPGDAVWTDGKCIYGWVRTNKPDFLPEFGELEGLLYYDIAKAIVYKYRDSVLAKDISAAADFLVDGEAATWIVLKGGGAMSLSTGLVCPYLPGMIECVTPAGELLSWVPYSAEQGAGGLYIFSTVTDKENKQVSPMMRENLSYQEKCADMLAAAQGYAAAKFAEWCPVGESSGYFSQGAVTIHPDGTATAQMSAAWGIDGETSVACPKIADLSFYDGYSGDTLDEKKGVNAEEDVLCSFTSSASASVDFVMDTLTGNREFHRQRTWSSGYSHREDETNFFTTVIRYVYSKVENPDLSAIENGEPARILNLAGVSFTDYMEPPSYSEPAPAISGKHTYYVYNGNLEDESLQWGCVDLIILTYPETPYPTDGGGDFGTWNSFDWRLDHATAKVDFLYPEWGGTTVCSLWGISEEQGYMLTDAYTMKDGTRLVVAWGKRGYSSGESGGKLHVIGKDGSGVLCENVANSRVAYCKNLAAAKKVLSRLKITN